MVHKLKAVILTHQDLNHIGSLPEILQESNSTLHPDSFGLEGRLALS